MSEVSERSVLLLRCAG